MERHTAAAVASGALMGLAGPLSRLLGGSGMRAEEIAMTRFGVAAAIFGLVMVRTGKQGLRVRAGDLWIFLGAGILGQFAFAFFYFRAVTLAPLAVVSALSAVYPFVVLLFSRLVWRERLTKEKMLALLLAILGSTLVSGAFRAGSIPFDGALTALASGVAYALFCIFSRFAVMRGYAPRTINFYAWCGALLCAVFAWPGLHPLSGMFSSWQNAVICLILGGVVGCGANYLFSYSLTALPAGRATILASSSPLVAMAGGAILFREVITMERLFGVMILLLAIFLLNRKDVRPAPAKAGNDTGI